MGALTLPDSGLIYLDASPIIYAVEKVPPYHTLLQPLWERRLSQLPYFVGSELLLLETLVKPVQVGNVSVETLFRQFLNAKEMQMVPISRAILETALQLRATTRLKTPDAIHAATALQIQCKAFITNDPAFRRVSDLTVIVLSEFLSN